MPKMKLVFKKEETDEIYTTTDVKNARTVEREGSLPECVIGLQIDVYDIIKTYDTCDVFYFDKHFFAGQISAFFFEGEKFEVELVTKTFEDSIPKTELEEEAVNVLAKFRRENPEIMVQTSMKQVTRDGRIKDDQMLDSNSKTTDVTQEIAQDSLKIEESKGSEISEVSLDISASWIAKIEGGVGLSSAIANRFRCGKINTLTPAKLIDSWPSFGDRIANRSNGKCTKYFIASSRLTIDQSMSRLSAPISISEDIPKVRLKHEFFNSKLTLAWEFDQFMSETFSSKIVNKLASGNRKEKLKINLKNVNEYITDPKTGSFFATEIGSLINKDIYKSIGNYIALSMRNIEASCNLHLCEKTLNLICGDWICINERKLKIVHLEHDITPERDKITIKAAGFSTILPTLDFLHPPPFEPPKYIEFRPEDVIHDISIQNDGSRQYEKLVNYIAEQMVNKKINLSNYKSLISKFLNKNQTKIRIVTKPLKTEHRKKININIGKPVEFCGHRK
jgi:hypothetical protein